MQKIYILLRNNQQTGPFTLNELVQFDLKPYDLIWIQGKSAGWYYPQEIKALHPYLSFVKKPSQPVHHRSPQKENTIETMASTKPFVATPSSFVKEESTTLPSFAKEELTSLSPFDTRMEPSANLSNETESLAAALSQGREVPSPNNNMKTTITPVSYPKRKKQPVVSTTGIVIACALVGVLGYFIAKPFINGEDTNEAEQTVPPPSQTEIKATNVSATTISPNNQLASLKKQKQQKEVTIVRQITTIVKQPTNRHNEVVAGNESVLNNTGTAPVENENKPVANEEKKNEPVVAEAPAEKKKTLRDKIFDIFRKKPQEEKKEETKPADQENGERKSTHRETNLTQMVSVRFTIPNDWMAGIKGAKATLQNHSNETVAKAVIELLYYNDDNELLDKKTVSFSNVEGKDSKTISIPDHPTATRLEYNILSVTGSGAPVAML